jgi:hypothetical protein
MEQVNNSIKKLNAMVPSKVQKYLDNPYVMSAIAILVVIYSGLIAHKLPHKLAIFMTNPIYKVVLFFVLLLIHKASPMVAILVAIAYIIITLMLTTVSNRPTSTATPNGQNLSPEEAEQIKQEIAEQHIKPLEGLHPLNKPTAETNYMDNKVLDPDDPKHPGWNVYNDPHIDRAIYELNPPFAYKNQPTGCAGIEKPNRANLKIPEGGPSRYSAYHGYKLSN